MRHVSIQDFKNKKYNIFWIVTHVSARDYMVTQQKPTELTLLILYPDLAESELSVNSEETYTV